METIGAHFSAIAGAKQNVMPKAYTYESARSCLFSLLDALGSKRVHVPNFICEAIPHAIKSAGAEVVRYAINEGFEPSTVLCVEPDDLCLVVNYFGLSSGAVINSLARLPPGQTVVDCSQAYFQEPFDCVGTFFSARKFIPVADGAFIATNARLQTYDADEFASIERYQYLLSRVGSEPEATRKEYLNAEASLDFPSLRAMSNFSKKIVESVDQDLIVNRRRSNFAYLSNALGFNELELSMEAQVPLCFPLMMKGGGVVRNRLREKRIFTPAYWPGVTAMNDFEHSLLQNTIYLPIDHRYDEAHMKHVINAVLNEI